MEDIILGYRLIFTTDHHSLLNTVWTVDLPLVNSLGTIAQFFHFVAEEKKDKKTKAFYDWATTGIPVIKLKVPYSVRNFVFGYEEDNV